MGYESRAVARKILFSRTRYLYDFNLENDPLVLLQSVLLMSYRFKDNNHQTDSWFWSGFPTSFVQTMDLPGLIRNSNPAAKRTKLLRRIWWCCFVRDTLVIENMKLPSKISVEDSNISMLTLDDFDILQDSQNVGQQIQAYSCLISDAEARIERASAIIYIEQVKLCICINRILSAHSSAAVLTRSEPAFGGGVSNAAMSSVLAREIKACDSQLMDWLQALSLEAIWPGADLDEDAISDDALRPQRILLHMTYSAAVSILHRPQVLPSRPEAPLARHMHISLRTLSRNRIHHVAQHITQLAETILQYDLFHYIPPYR